MTTFFSTIYTLLLICVVVGGSIAVFYLFILWLLEPKHDPIIQIKEIMISIVDNENEKENVNDEKENVNDEKENVNNENKSK